MTPNANTSSTRLHDLRRPLALAVALAFAPFASTVLAQAAQGQLPRAGVVAGGAASISYNPGQTTLIPLTQSTTITQTSKGAIINWGSFNIGPQNTVNFNHQVSGGVTLNRVIGFLNGPPASRILGALNSPRGGVFLINPSGIVFGANAQVNVGGLVASTLNISDANFNTGVNSGHYVFDPGLGTVDNQGTINGNAGGTVALLGSEVSNEGSITTPQGTIALGAGSQLTLDIGGDGLTQLTINVGANDAAGVTATNAVGAKLVADGGQVLMQSVNLGANSFASVVNDGLVQARSLQSRGGRIVLSSSSDDGNDGVSMTGTLDASGTTAGVAGGYVGIDADLVSITPGTSSVIVIGPPVPVPSVINVSGATGGGTISIVARDVAAIDPSSSLLADATLNGNGGSILASGMNGLYGFGNFYARGGTNGGNGGTIQTSGGGFDLNGIRVNASAARGTAGTWLINAINNASIIHGNAIDAIPLRALFTPITTANIQDNDISNALNSNTNVTVRTAASRLKVGNVTFQNADIERTSGAVATTFRIDANGSILNTAGGGNTIAATNGAGLINIAFDANATSAYNGDAYNGNINLLGMNLLTNGGNVMLYGQNDPLNGYAASSQLGIHFDGGRIDTRVGQSDAGAGGILTMRGVANNSVLAETGIDISGTRITTSTGAITLRGSILGGDDAGVGLSGMIVGNTFVRTLLSTTSGDITLDGTSLANNNLAAKWGVRTADSDITTRSGTIAIMGRAEGTANSTFLNRGVQIGANTSIVNGSGRTLIAGEASSDAAGVEISTGASVNGGSGTLVIQARNNGNGDALVINGTLADTGTIDLRPGGVNINGNVTEDPNDAIALGGNLGFAISSAELTNIAATTLVLGSDIQVGRITVSGSIGYNHNLTLDGGAGGGIAVNGALNLGGDTLALISAGDITQRAPITSKSLLVISSSSLVNLDNAGNNVSSATLAGSASGNFTFVNAGTVGIGNVSAIGFAAAPNAPLTLTASGVHGNDVLVRALTGNMLLEANVSGNDVDLVSAGIFDNPGGNTITASGIWRVWGNSWIGETRGGVAGSGTLPNLYGCAFGATCSVTPSDAANQFIYIAQPTATINVADATREYGLPNGSYGFTVGGLILGDQAANAINGTTLTGANQASNVGSYAINGNFVSPAGYLIDVVPGQLAITPATLTYIADPYTRVYGDPNGALAGSVSGLRLADTLASSTSGTLAFSSNATQGSNVGTYAINGGGLTSTNYVFAQAPGNASAFTISPATLTYIADPYQRLVGVPNGELSGSVGGFRNGDTLASSTTGTLLFQTNAGTSAPVGSYAIDGSGLVARNYVFTQANGNAVAMTITPPLGTYTLDVVRDTPVTYVYDRNFGIVGLCPATDLASDSRDKDGDTLAREWSRVRSRPNLANCVSTKQKNSCGDF